MIQNCDIQKSSSFHDLSCNGMISFRWIYITRGMIVGKDQAWAKQHQRFMEEASGVYSNIEK